MARIREDETRDIRLRATLAGFEIKDDGTVRQSSSVSRSHSHMQRMKDRRARRGH
jgi:hypothetical protein